VIYTFFWSPEGRRLGSFRADSVASAKAQFRSVFPEHAKYMGEVYYEVTA